MERRGEQRIPSGPSSRATASSHRPRLDRRVIYLLLALGTLVPILFPIGFPVSVTPPVKALFERIESLAPGSVVLVSFDYGPNIAPEMDPMADAVLRHCFERGLRVVVIALFPVGGLTMAGEALARIVPEYPALRPGEDYVFLGYKDGTQAVMKQMDVSFAAVFPLDARGIPIERLPLMQEAPNFAGIDLVVSLSTNEIGEWWVTLVNAQFGVPVAVGSTAVWAPKYFAFLDARQMVGLLAGLKGASEYERLLTASHARLAPRYERAGVYTASRAMDAQTIDHALVMALIVLGNVFFFMGRRSRRGEAQREPRGPGDPREPHEPGQGGRP
ncbi:MAG: hypothetical protein KBD56_03350 [Candidatus Eisenbacteria bacterium]|nr:hypothetical protein [Candidatus Eisenbacteria bacterium]